MTSRIERFTAPDGVRLRAIHYGEGGDGSAPPLVLLHGGGSNAHWWDHLAPELARRFHVVALDFRGHGDSDYPEEVRLGAFSDDLDALLDHLGRPDALLAGHSMGAHIALERAARLPGTPALVLIDLAWRTPRRAGRMARRTLAAARRSYVTREEAIDRYTFVPDAPLVPEALRRAIAERSVRATPEGRYAYKFDARWFALPSRPPPDLARVRCPVLLLRGAASPMLSEEGARALTAALADARLVEIESGGHHVHLDRPADVLEALVSFLAAHLPG